MAKQRKEYLGVAEKCILEIFKAYANDNGVVPAYYTPLKGALTKAFNKIHHELYEKACYNLGITSDWRQQQSRHQDIYTEMTRIVKEQ